MTLALAPSSVSMLALSSALRTANTERLCVGVIEGLRCHNSTDVILYNQLDRATVAKSGRVSSITEVDYSACFREIGPQWEAGHVRRNFKTLQRLLAGLVVELVTEKATENPFAHRSSPEVN